MNARIGNIGFDCADVISVAAFWSSVLDRPLDEGASAEFASIGGADVERARPALYFHRVPEPKRAKNRVHLDLFDPELGAIDHLVELGARVLERHEIGHHAWTVLQDPEGNEFCVAARPYGA